MNRWHAALIEVLDVPASRSLGLVLDVRHAVLRQWEQWLKEQGVPVDLMPQIPARYSLRRGEAQEHHPLTHLAGRLKTPRTMDSEFCRRYGFGSYSEGAINYLLRDSPATQLSDFLRATDTPSLGNFAIQAPLESKVCLAPPEELAVCGTLDVERTTRFRVFAWLGVRFSPERATQSLLEQIAEAVQLKASSARRLEDDEDDPPLVFPPCVATDSFWGAPMASPEDDWEMESTPARSNDRLPPVRGEQRLYEAVCEIFGSEKVMRRRRLPALEGLEIDVWVPDRQLAFEFNGEQHYKHVAAWHGADGLKRQRERDRRKAQLCELNGIRLLVYSFREGRLINRERVLNDLWARLWL